MIIAREKRRNNISEYMLYMWHIEDIIRACNFDFDIVRQKLIDGYTTDTNTIKEITEWYKGLIEMMRYEGITKTGHLQMLKNIVTEMYEVHIKLLNNNKEEQYKHVYYATKPDIDMFRKKSNDLNSNDIEICLNALHLLLLMKLSNKEVSLTTMESMNDFSKLLAALSTKYKDWGEGKLIL